MTDKEREEFFRWLQTHTALGRIGLGELRETFDRAATAGYVVSKTEPAGGNV